MKNKELIPDYVPKTTPDTVYDYLRESDSIVYRILEKFNQPQIKHLKDILKYFNKYKIAAEKNPGEIRQDNIAIGADMDQYYPSEEEIIVSELGKLILFIIDSNSSEKIYDIKKIERIPSQKIKFNKISFRYVDVMGSGRFFYAEKEEPQITVVI
ncbi:MAG: hypothetical protein ACFE9Z_13210 [Promethearchaeota archaeon]